MRRHPRRLVDRGARPAVSCSAVYPFERFSESAKKALTLAQEEAERSQQRYVGPEHLVVGILRVSDSVGAAILDMLGVHLDEVRAGIGSLPESLKSPTGQIIPTSRVKRVIEISFQEARRLGEHHVGTHHLLLGLLMAGDSAAADLLVDRDVSLERVRGALAELQRVGRGSEHGSRPGEARPAAPPSRANLDRLLARAVSVAAEEAASHIDDGHVLLAMLLHSAQGRAARTLRRIGVDTDRLIRLLHPPRHVVELRKQLRDLDASNPATAEELERLHAALEDAEQRWLASLDAPPEPPHSG